jgi:hypothetical protein
MTSNVFQISDLALVERGLKVGAPEGLKRLNNGLFSLGSVES